MSKATVVIGANYGDEGKGLMTDYFCRTKDADIVVRFNGGAQAGHTVVTPEGTRHVFSHFGAGTLAGVPTFLSRFFIVNPIIYKKERESLLVKGVIPKITIDPRCMMTTPWDMLWNQFQEELRGDARHGSCGMGINATITRYEKYPQFSFSVPRRIWDLYKGIMEEFIPKESEKDIFTKYYAYMHDEGIYASFLHDIEYMDSTIIDEDTAPLFTHAILEGAQGLALDEYMGEYPHVTRSNTGLRNVKALQWEYGFDIDEITYVTRSYLTRHGAGPFTEFEERPESINERTNVNNQWQGSMRFGPLFVSELFDRINLDLTTNAMKNANWNIAVTHCDEMSPIGALSCAEKTVYTSYGPVCDAVKIKEN